MLDFLFLLDGKTTDSSKGGSIWSTLIMIVLLIAIFYLFMIRPQQKKQKKLQEAREALKQGDRIVTIGGIHGKIIDIREHTFVIAVEDNSHIEIEKAAVSFSENELK